MPTLWDKLRIQGNQGLRKVIARVRDKQSLKGSIIQGVAWDVLYDNFKVETERLNIYKEIWEMLSETPLADQAARGLSTDATTEQFRVVATSERVERIIRELMDRINYMENRQAYLYRGFCFGDLFLERAIDKINGRFYTSRLNVLPETTMFRNSNRQDIFENERQAFGQSLSGVPQGKIISSADTIYFDTIQVTHARYCHLFQKYPKYGMSAWYSSRKVYKIVLMLLQDMAISRHISAGRKLGFEIDNTVSSDREGESAVDYVRRLVEGDSDTPKYENPLTNFYLPEGVKINLLDPRNFQLSATDDVQIALAVLSIGLGYPVLKLLGYRLPGGGAGGKEVEYSDIVLERAIKRLNEFEKTEILVPLINFELGLNGIFNAKYDIIFPEPTVENENTKSRRLTTEVTAERISRESAWTLQGYKEILGHDWEEELKRIKEELKVFEKGEVKERKPQDQFHSSKGDGNGSENKNIADFERITGHTLEDVLRSMGRE